MLPFGLCSCIMHSSSNVPGATLVTWLYAILSSQLRTDSSKNPWKVDDTWPVIILLTEINSIFFLFLEYMSYWWIYSNIDDVFILWNLIYVMLKYFLVKHSINNFLKYSIEMPLLVQELFGQTCSWWKKFYLRLVLLIFLCRFLFTFFIDCNSLHSPICACVIWIDICLLSCSCWRFRVLPHLILFQAAHVAVKQYVASTFSHLLLNISGYSCCYRVLNFFPWRKRY